ncbi:MAG: hypothetical protein PQJ49_08795 [Sphaerochaetaceae bacterium]|nr:hypothetical protein [Sphaerochaetaceae bacterium]MDC7238199.1 hypothetical protein [Sphaerochaetaceae bacterium]MDC7249995.1 hypothetical protein [Sphaerochaetaceae bacterium]
MEINMEVSTQPNNKPTKKANKRRKNKNQAYKRAKNSKDGKDLLPPKKKVTPKSSLPPVEIKRIKEPLVKCNYCNKVINNISSAIKGDDCYYHFDCVIDRIKKEHKVKESQSVSYIGRGSFAIIEKDETGALKFVETIQVETPQQFDSMKKYIEEVKI